MTPRPRTLPSRPRLHVPATRPCPADTRPDLSHVQPGLSHRKLSPGRPQGDAGATLIELTVTMTIMSVLLAMFTGAVLHMTRAANATQSVASAQSQITIAYQRLDREVRYAAGISQQKQVGTSHYIEYLTSNTAVPTCTGLRLDTATQRLQYRRWPQGKTPGPWTVLASGVTPAQPPGATSPPEPFTRIPNVNDPADPKVPFQRLQLRITAGDEKAATDVMFTALNSSSDSNTGTVCTEGRTTT